MNTKTISIITYGSYGDVAPYIPLGKALVENGYDVRFISHDRYKDTIEKFGMEYHYGCDDTEALLKSPQAKGWLRQKPLRSLMNMSKLIEPYLNKIASATYQAAKGSDLIIFSIVGGVVAHDIAEALNIPSIGAYVMPLTPTKTTSNYLMPYMLPFGFLNRLSFSLPSSLIALAFRKIVNNVRSNVLDLPPFSRKEINIWDGRYENQPIIYGVSPSVVKKPYDWGDWIKMTGYWFPDFQESYEPDESLADFIKSGEKPVYIGFGSMSDENSERRGSLIKDALELSDSRAVICKGWGGIAGLDNLTNVFISDFVDHKWLFPQMAAIIHHGGSGTTAQGFRAGVPQIITPFFADQYFWSRKVTELGCGPKTKPIKLIKSADLARYINTIKKQPRFCESSEKVSKFISNENGINSAISNIRNLIF